jgi:hypothetical protein
MTTTTSGASSRIDFTNKFYFVKGGTWAGSWEPYLKNSRYGTDLPDTRDEMSGFRTYLAHTRVSRS